MVDERGAWFEAQTPAGRVALDPSVGNIRHLSFAAGPRRIAPLHSAPWVDDPAIQGDATIHPVERRLSGDFFCAPFGRNDVEPAPTHGWPANSAWSLAAVDAAGFTVELERPVMGARIA